MISDAAYKDLEAVVGSENASREPAVLDTYAWQPYANENPDKWVTRPIAVVLPASTEQVQGVVRACNRHGIKFKPFSVGWGAWGGPSEDNIVQVDLRRMGRILEIDEKNMYAVVEPFVICGHLQAEAMKRGLNAHVHGSGPNCSPLASATSSFGVGNDSIYMAFSPRNVLSVEWVLPDGEVLTLGSAGSDAGWFVGDGPGPSLRGILRGSVGAFGGLGIITKCAIKLFDWAGPPVIETTGTVLNAQSKVPENTVMYSLFFPDKDKFNNAVYDISDAELGYNMVRVNPIMMKTFMEQMGPGSEKIKDDKYHIFFMLHGHSKDELDYQKKALSTILEKNGGTALDYAQAPQIQAMLYMNLFRSTLWALVFKKGGCFHTMVGRNDTIDLQTELAEVYAKIKAKSMEKNLCLDPVADNPYYVTYENGTWAHVEVVFQYDPRRRDQIENMKNLALANLIGCFENFSEPKFSHEPHYKKFTSPLCGDFGMWQQKISEKLDPNQAADTGRYLKEEDFHTEGLDQELVKRLNELYEKHKWVDGHPPA